MRMDAISFQMLAYMLAAFLFILALAGLSRQETAKRGNYRGMCGMAVALAATVGLSLAGAVDIAAPAAIIACAAGVASLDLFAGGDYPAKVARIESELRAGLAGVESLPNVRAVRILGAVGAVETERLPARADIERVIDETGVWLRPFANFIYAMPPLVSDSGAIRRITAAISALAACPPGPEQSGDFHE